MNNRIKELRNELKMTQDDFAKKLGLARNSIANYEIARRIPSNAVIKSICREFGVSEDWLRNGTEPKYIPIEDEEAAYVSDLLEESDNDLFDLIKAIMKTYSESGEKEKIVLKTFAKNLKENMMKDRD